MWYFSWILGTGLACAFAILNALWLELRAGEAGAEAHLDTRKTSDRNARSL